MAVSPEPSHTTSLTAPVSIWAALDEVRAARARSTGKRPKVRELLLEALRAFIERETREANVH